MHAGCRVLDLCCGDGFYSYFFFSDIARHIDAVDIDDDALHQARTRNVASNITYTKLDVTTGSLPEDAYDVICWDGAIAHFPLDDVARILSKLKKSLKPNGVLCGSEELQTDDNKSWDHHFAIPSPDRLHEILTPFFPELRVLLRPYPREILYFRCGQSPERLGSFR